MTSTPSEPGPAVEEPTAEASTVTEEVAGDDQSGQVADVSAAGSFDLE